MKTNSFFKLLNRKIQYYDRLASNPFEKNPLPITLVWVEEYTEDKKKDKD